MILLQAALWLLGALALLGLVAVVRHRQQLARLTWWARQPIGTPVPNAAGPWGEAFAALHQRAKLASEQRTQINIVLEQFRQAIQALPDGVAILDDRLAIEWLNGHAEHLLGLDTRRDAGCPIINLVREPEFVAYLRSGSFGEPTVFRSSREQGHTLQVQAIPFGQGHTMVLVRDITQMERLETMRRDFVANVSHELKTPLTVISGFVETLEDAWQEMRPEEVHHFLALAGEQGGRMRRLIEDLLTLSALETDAPPLEEQVDMAAILAEVREEATVLSSERHAITLEDAGPDRLLGSPREIRSALANLASNAVRYTPSGGQIRLTWARTAEGGAAFSVNDTGIGIDAKHISRLTERFYRVDRGRSRETGGTGLGLAIVKHVLERHGGRLVVESQLGKGSCFTALFPPRRVSREH